MIDIRDLRVRFGQGTDAVTAVDGITLSVREGESFGLVGESGSGKSTVLRAVSGLNDEWTGRIAVAGTEQGPKRHKGFYKLCQMVFQDPYGSLHPRHTVDRILAEPIAIHGLGDADARIDRVLRDVGLGSAFRFRYPHQLSGGQRQRVAIARALVLEPRILLLDEPTSALDIASQVEMLGLVRRLSRARGIGAVIVLHDINMAARICDEILAMRGGALIAQGTPDAIMTGETLGAIYRLAMGIVPHPVTGDPIGYVL